MYESLALPKRVSRLYPIFAFVLLLAASSFFYAWQETRIELESLPDLVAKNQDLQTRYNELAKTSSQDQATLKLQKIQIDQATTKLTDLQTQLTSLNDQIGAKDTQLKNQQSQLSQNASELQNLRNRPPLFSFQNNSSNTNLSSQETQVKDVVSKAYDYIRQIYGEPYLLSNIKITFVDKFDITGSSGEILIENGPKGISIDIHLKSFDKHNFQDVNTIIHEMIHGFHGVAVFQSSAYEEGITVAATDAVMQEMINDSKLDKFDHLYLSLDSEQYLQYNKDLKVVADNDKFYLSPDISEVYQLIGEAWFKFYQADKNFFKELNTAYYPKIQKGQTAENSLVLDSIRATIKKVNGQSIDEYLNQNQAFNPK